MRTIAVILSGCGVQDGTEIHEAVAVLYALSERGVKAVCLAPGGEQHRVVNHAAGTPVEESRVMLEEGARIARGDISLISNASPASFDGVIIPGGFGAALNLCDFAISGRRMVINPELEDFLNGCADADKPLAALCIAPPILAKLMERRGVTGALLTIGSDPDTAQAIEAMGQTHVKCLPSDAVVDPTNRLVTGPAYMLAGNMAELFDGIGVAVDRLLELSLQQVP
jgi:enhancing lycopene biosynthesis protein 2